VGLGGSQRAHRRHKLAALATPAGAAEIMELPRVSPIQAGAIPVCMLQLNFSAVLILSGDLLASDSGAGQVQRRPPHSRPPRPPSHDARRRCREPRGAARVGERRPPVLVRQTAARRCSIGQTLDGKAQQLAIVHVAGSSHNKDRHIASRASRGHHARASWADVGPLARDPQPVAGHSWATTLHVHVAD